MATALFGSRSCSLIAFGEKLKLDRCHLPPNAPDLVLRDHDVEVGKLVYLLDCSIQRSTAEIGPVRIAVRPDVQEIAEILDCDPHCWVSSSHHLTADLIEYERIGGGKLQHSP